MASASLRVRLTPRSSRSSIDRIEAGVVHARVSAAPVDGAANRALTELLSGALGVPKSALTLEAGATAREKRFHVEGLDIDEAMRRLNAQLTGSVRRA